MSIQTVDGPQIGQFLKVEGSCGDVRAVIQSNSFPDIGQVLKARGLSGFEECPFRGRTVNCRQILPTIASVLLMDTNKIESL
jgi:hypothetical protein